jgi:hypothetical protein
MTKCDNCFCAIEEDDENICVDCGKTLCITCVRVPDPDVFLNTKVDDRCIECNARAGYADIGILHSIPPNMVMLMQVL